MTVRRVALLGAGVVVAVLVGLVAIVAFPGLVGGDAAFFVTSGSMSPSIDSGDVLIVSESSPADVEVGDVVTVQTGDEPNPGYVTHRVVDVEVVDGEYYFQIQGDANPEPDPGYATADDVVGTSHLQIPYVGSLLVFARSGIGIAVLVVLPGLALLTSGCLALVRELSALGTDTHPDRRKA
ncbi:signal peptidase I [Halovivax gelatinilyticus]|uniref:signal peptidase I n=1 Tax=Halovivax gelatinilyticus TaxID=2961597 RepID=UPI0020CA3AE1|nr:signal peptidase I [Halovivax gelatinilyticus]